MLRQVSEIFSQLIGSDPTPFDVPNVFQFFPVDPTRDQPKEERKVLKVARAKKRIHLPESFEIQIEEWRGFVDSIPGKKFDGVDIVEADDGEVEIVAGYGRSRDDRKVYTASDKADMQAFAAAQSGGNVTNIAG